MYERERKLSLIYKRSFYETPPKNRPSLLIAYVLIFLTLNFFSLTPAFSAECNVNPWESDIIYSRGDLVTHANHEWKAKRTSEGVTPGTHKPTWGDQGACDTPLPPVDPTPMQIYGLWHAGNHYADWSLPRDMVEFDEANHWIIDRGDGTGLPSVNLVILSFLQPMQVLNRTNDAITVDGVPIGMTQEIVDYFKNAEIRVMMSIGGQTYVNFWDEALATDAWQLGLNAAQIAEDLGVGMEIDYEQNSDPDLVGLQAFIDAYRSVHPYDPSGNNPAARLTIDLAAGGVIFKI